MMNRSRLEKEIDQVVAGAGVPSSGRRPLYGHTSESTAYQVDDYPYGFRERTQIQYWIEAKPKKGWRFVSRTRNPKTGHWNKPKESTYADWGAAMFIDENGHVQWSGIGQYSSDRQILSFLREFPGAPSMIGEIAPAKIKFLKGMINDEIFFTINGIRQQKTEADFERLRDELSTWEEIGCLVAR